LILINKGESESYSSMSIKRNLNSSKSIPMKQFILAFFVSFAMAASHADNERVEWTGQRNLSDDGHGRWDHGNDWDDGWHDGRGRRHWWNHRRRHHHGDWDDGDWSGDWAVNDWSDGHVDWSDGGGHGRGAWSNDWALGDWPVGGGNPGQGSGEDWAADDQILDSDASCVKCPKPIVPCKCPAPQKCRLIQRTCRTCAHYICVK
jgi:hypothetical protein